MPMPLRSESQASFFGHSEDVPESVASQEHHYQCKGLFCTEVHSLRESKRIDFLRLEASDFEPWIFDYSTVPAAREATGRQRSRQPDSSQLRQSDSSMPDAKVLIETV